MLIPQMPRRGILISELWLKLRVSTVFDWDEKRGKGLLSCVFSFLARKRIGPRVIERIAEKKMKGVI